MRAILINPWTRTIHEVDVPCEEDNYKAIYPFLSEPAVGDDPGHRVTCFDIRNLGQGRGGEEVSMYFDDEGCLMSGVPMFEMGVQMFPGRALVLGADGWGNTVATSLTVEDVRKKVNWINEETTGEFEPMRSLEGQAALDWIEKNNPNMKDIMGDNPFVQIGGQAMTQPRGTEAAKRKP